MRARVRGFCLRLLRVVPFPATVTFGMKDIRFLAIFAGLAVDIGGSLGAGLAMGIVIALFHLMQGMPIKELSAAMDQKHLLASIPIDLANLGAGGFFSLLGGFVTGWIARVSRTKNACIMGVVSTALSVFFWAYEPMWMNALGCVFTLIPATLGGVFSQALFGHRTPPPIQA